jgi:predicted transcriptional regulator
LTVAISLRLPPDVVARLEALADKTGKTITALILDALDETYHPKKSRAEIIGELAGWMSSEDAAQLREAVGAVEVVDEGDCP